ncbi:DUF448 domain-containing protein [Candidatus Planktophila limnetica]|uniref:DUF448 domain-containing protein n=1 Tax=Candidatus Planktophila limnetica TaxID=573600 RepID=A0A249LGV9_9ACTN|nr:DUF448 domain-containing protein [Candidatus Planktophila limnetica]
MTCRKQSSPTSLLRVVCIDGALVLDNEKSLPGRGAWVHQSCLATAISRGAFKYALKLTEQPNELDAKDMKLK